MGFCLWEWSKHAATTSGDVSVAWWAGLSLRRREETMNVAEITTRPNARYHFFVASHFTRIHPSSCLLPPYPSSYIAPSCDLTTMYSSTVNVMSTLSVSITRCCSIASTTVQFTSSVTWVAKYCHWHWNKTTIRWVYEHDDNEVLTVVWGWIFAKIWHHPILEQYW